jgi:phosphoribosylamine--glycine ligase
MKVCVVGSGGREHALASVLARSTDVIVTPGNPGMAGISAEGHSVEVTGAPPEDVEAGMYVIGPEVPLVQGLADRLRAAGHLVFGPGADGARLEGSKAFMKETLVAAGVPTARFGVFSGVREAREFLATLSPPYVVKTDGLAGGKGVLVTQSLAEAEDDVLAKLRGDAFGDAGRRVVIEEGLVGPECSLLVLCDGRRVAPMLVAQDFKRLGDGGTGPNTGGMGAYCPVGEIGGTLVDTMMDEAVEPLVAELRRQGIDYRGVLYAGLMLTADGPRVLEYNVRFGDPEAQVVLPLLVEDLAGLLAEAASGRLRTEPRFESASSVCVVMTAPGYPLDPSLGHQIQGLDAPSGVEGVTVYHAGTGLDPSGRPVTAGGRVLDVAAIAPGIAEARRKAYEAVSRIGWEGVHYRSDIAEAAALVEAHGGVTPGSVGVAAGDRRRG